MRHLCATIAVCIAIGAFLGFQVKERHVFANEDVFSRTAWASGDLILAGGVWLGMPRSTALKTLGINHVSLMDIWYPDKACSPGAERCDEDGSGHTDLVRLTFADGRLSSVQYTPPFFPERAPNAATFELRGQTSTFFNNYSDGLRLKLLGKPDAAWEQDLGTAQHVRQYDYHVHGLIVQTTSYLRNGMTARTPPELDWVEFCSPCRARPTTGYTHNPWYPVAAGGQ